MVNKTMKNILITGGEGMIAKELRELLQNTECDINILDIKNGDDIRDYRTCKRFCRGIDEVYHLFGIKGNPKMTKNRPADFMLPMLQGDTNMIRAAHESNVKRFLYTSSIAVLFPESDEYPAWAKQTAEKLIGAMRIQYPYNDQDHTRYCIVRPANVYGRFDNFENPNAMVITSLINKALHNDELHVWGDGSQTRDFINAKDVARNMIKSMNSMPTKPVNLCSGKSESIGKVAEIIGNYLNKPVLFEGQNVGASHKKMKKTHLLDIQVGLEEGIIEAIKWRQKNP